MILTKHVLGGFPGSKQIAYLWEKNQVPVGAILFVLAANCVLILLNLVNETAFMTVTSIVTIGTNPFSFVINSSL